MSTIEPEIQRKLMNILKEEEEKTDLENLAVLSRVGMKVASSSSAELDADATSASATALIDLGLRLSEATYHGALKEIVMHNDLGYIILMAINDEYIVFGGLKNPYRIGYYLGYIRDMAKKLNILISGGEITEMALSMEGAELEKIKPQEIEEEVVKPIKPSVTEDIEALDGLLNFLDEWEKEGIDFEDLDTGAEGGIVSIPKSISVDVLKSEESVGPSIDELESFNEELEIGTEIPLPTSKSELKSSTDFKVYPDEVPPVPLEDYTPIEVGSEETEEISAESEQYEYPVSEATESEAQGPYVYEPIEESSTQEEIVPPEELPPLDELEIPDFDSEFSATEYDVDFILEEESEALDKVLKELGWDDEEK
ncbi:MAG: hypothetical protein ACTSQP_04735 [Promethearchaeota archaeon]